LKRTNLRAEREFGIVVGSIFTLLSAWWIYRGKFSSVSQITLPLGVVLILLGLFVPRILVYPNKAWMLLAQGLSYVTTPIILGLVFFFVVTPIGFVKRLSGWDPLRRRAGSSTTYWKPYSERQHNTRHYEKMY
jgi:hypothetical protein